MFEKSIVNTKPEMCLKCRVRNKAYHARRVSLLFHSIPLIVCDTIIHTEHYSGSGKDVYCYFDLEF